MEGSYTHHYTTNAIGVMKMFYILVVIVVMAAYIFQNLSNYTIKIHKFHCM